MTSRIQLPAPPKLMPYMQDPGSPGNEHDGKFYFIRAFSTALGVLAGWTVWLLALAAVGIVIILLFGGPGAVIPEEDGIRDPQPGSDYSLACDPATEQC